MVLVICMAGFNTRFHDVGYDMPKYLLPWKNNTIIHEILKQLTANYMFNKVILLANKRDIYFKPQLLRSTEEYFPIIEYIGDTIGQAHTAAIGAKLITDNDMLMIHNADTIVGNRNIGAICSTLLANDAFIDVFSADSPEYCYVNAVNNKVTNIVEKNTLSEFASSGLYCFKDTNTYLANYEVSLNKQYNKELYISDVLSNMVKAGLDVVINKINPSHITTVIGSPREYNAELLKLQDENN